MFSLPELHGCRSHRGDCGILVMSPDPSKFGLTATHVAPYTMFRASPLLIRPERYDPYGTENMSEANKLLTFSVAIVTAAPERLPSAS